MTETPWQEQKEALGGFIRAQRELASLSLRQLADIAQISNAYLSQIERGLHEPSIRVLKSVAEGLGLSTEMLLEQAGLLEEDATTTTTEEAIRSDPRLTAEEKQALLSVYNSYTAGRE